MEKLDIFLITAIACGHKAVIENERCWIEFHGIHGTFGGESGGAVWDPFTFPHQRWECIERMLLTGDVRLGSSVSSFTGFNHIPYIETRTDMTKEMPARLLAELYKHHRS